MKDGAVEALVYFASNDEKLASNLLTFGADTVVLETLKSTKYDKLRSLCMKFLGTVA